MVRQLRSRFTLTELLAVVLVILLLASLFTTIAGIAEAKALASSCSQNLRQLGTIFSVYQMDHRHYPASAPSRFGDRTGWADLYMATDPGFGYFLPSSGDKTIDPRLPRMLSTTLNPLDDISLLCCPDFGASGFWKDLGPYDFVHFFQLCIMLPSL